MNTAVTKAEESLPAISNETAAVLSMIERVATDPNADIGKLEKMLDMQERVLNRQAQEAFSADMAAMQSELPRVAKLARGHNSNYARLEDINDAVRPILQRHGFAVTFRVNQSESAVKIVTILSHRQGHREETDILLPADTSGNKNDVQAIGSTISYGKRYGICAILNISTGDDTDGQLPNQADSDYSKTADWVAKMDECANLNELKEVWEEAWKDVTSALGRRELTAAKNAKGKELKHGTA